MTSPIVLITGAYRGIGLEAARQFIQQGARVIITSRRRSRGTMALLHLGHQAVFLELDVTDAGSIVEAAAAIRSQFGRLDVLVNNTAVLLDPSQGILDLGADVLRSTLETNLVAPLRVTQAMVPLLRRSEAPRVINVGSGAGQLSAEPDAWAPAYAISKAALNMLTRKLAAALPGIAVNAMCPASRAGAEDPESARSLETAADTLVWLGLEASQSLTGGFFRDRVPLAW